MLGNLTGWHALVVLAVILLLFGAAKLPALAKSVGQSAKIFKNEIKTDKADKAADVSTEPEASPLYSSPSAPAAENPPKP